MDETSQAERWLFKQRSCSVRLYQNRKAALMPLNLKVVAAPDGCHAVSSFELRDLALRETRVLLLASITALVVTSFDAHAAPVARALRPAQTRLRLPPTTTSSARASAPRQARQQCGGTCHDGHHGRHDRCGHRCPAAARCATPIGAPTTLPTATGRSHTATHRVTRPAYPNASALPAGRLQRVDREPDGQRHGHAADRLVEPRDDA